MGAAGAGAEAAGAGAGAGLVIASQEAQELPPLGVTNGALLALGSFARTHWLLPAR